MQPAIKMALRAARQNSDFLKDQQARLDADSKAPEAVVRTVHAIEHRVHERTDDLLKRSYKDHWIAPAGEVEAGEWSQSWHVFPILGERNFARGLPEFATALLQKINDRPENLVVLCPLTGEEYAFSRGYGAVLNSQRIRARSSQHLTDTLISCNLFNRGSKGEDSGVWMDVAGSLVSEGADLQYNGCSVLDIARVAGGYLDATVLATDQRHEQVMASLISQEAGAVGGDLKGNPLGRKAGELVVANNMLFREILQQSKAYRQRMGSA
ncbi:inositol monophosphatase family protein [Halomonadaceae bacterium KBTZ08]